MEEMFCPMIGVWRMNNFSLNVVLNGEGNCSVLYGYYADGALSMEWR